MSDSFLEHDTGEFHPETSKRLISIQNLFKTKSYISSLPGYSPRPATEEEILRIHNSSHLKKIQSIQGRSGYLDGDTPFSPGSVNAAFLAAGSGPVLADAIHRGEIENAFAIVRPPGHHAEKSHAMGFCMFNNVAITARYLQTLGYNRIFILDWDVHHGNGTETAFYSDPDIFFLSLHQYPFYPGSGSELDRGEGEGLGKNLNIPMPRGSGDSEYKLAFEKLVLPSLESFEPDFILISAGFDAHGMDPLGGLELSTKGFEFMSFEVCKKAKEICGGRIISFLEGGYDLFALAESAEVHLSVLSDN